MMGIWCEIKPLSPGRSKRQWVFALYYETPSERDDGLWYEAFLFRDEDRSVFGLKEQIGDHLVSHFQDYRAMATRVMKDKEFRTSLISNNPELPRMWRKH
jgi:hypothetical protein